MARRPLKAYRQGEPINIEYKIYDELKRIRRPLDPSGGVRLSLFRPDGVLVLDKVPMAQIVEDGQALTGLYRYVYDSEADDMLGWWQVEVEASHGGSVGVSAREAIFALEA